MAENLTPQPSDRASVHRIVSSTSTSSHASEVQKWTYPRGHLPHLTPQEENVLQQFKLAAAEKNLYRPGTPPSDSDETLLRFIRARKWVVADAMKQFESTLTWRRANQIDLLYETIDAVSFEQSWRVYPQWTGRRDKRGIPVFVFPIKSIDSKTVLEYDRQGASAYSQAKFSDKTAPGLMRLFALYDNLVRFTMPLCSQLQDREFPGMPITMTNNIVDVSGVRLRQFWNLKSHLQAASQLATAHYPETLDRIYVVGAPSFFPTVWGWIKKWFDPVTVSKIFILSPQDVTPTLLTYIDRANLPRKYGGDLDWSFGEKATVDPAWKDVIDWAPGYSHFPVAPCYWEDSADGRRVACVLGGYVDGKPRREVICTMPKCWPPLESAAPLTPNPDVSESVASTTANGTAVPQPQPQTEAHLQSDRNGAPMAEKGDGSRLSSSSTIKHDQNEAEYVWVAAGPHSNADVKSRVEQPSVQVSRSTLASGDNIQDVVAGPSPVMAGS